MGAAAEIISSEAGKVHYQKHQDLKSKAGDYLLKFPYTAFRVTIRKAAGHGGIGEEVRAGDYFSTF